MKNKTFCAMPFVGMMTNTDGTMRTCCMASADATIKDNNNKKFLSYKDPIHSIWNSTFMQETRKSMINGNPIPACASCYNQEKNGTRSYRQYITAEWKQLIGNTEFENMIQQCQDLNFYANYNPLYLHLRLGNLCNLKCVMCNPYSSSQILEELKALWKIDDFRKNWQDEYDDDISRLSTETWHDHEFFWDELISISSSLKKVYLTGGEPTLIENTYKFLEFCQNNNYSKDIELSFNTNCTNITNRFINSISNFKNVIINASIDAYGTANEYIRYPSNWNKIDQNLRKLISLKNVKVNISTVAQLYNVMEHTKLLSYLQKLEDEYKKEIPISFNILTLPEYLDMLILPDAVRIEAVELLEQHLLVDSRYGQAVDGLIKTMLQPRKINHKPLLIRHKAIIDILDTKRKKKFSKIFPYLHMVTELELSN